MPAFLVGATGVFLRADLGVEEQELGFVIASFFGSSALASVLGGRLTERIGAGNVMSLLNTLLAANMIALGMFAGNLRSLILFMVVSGAGHGFLQPASSFALARAELRRPALMFGVKQSSVPAATMLAGASVPLLSGGLGWRSTFIVGGLLSGIVAAFVPRHLAPGSSLNVANRAGDAPLVPLLFLAIATGVGTAAATALGSFLVGSAVMAGFTPQSAGWLLVAGSLTCILSRLGVGALADAFQGRSLYMVSSMLFTGAVGFGLLAHGAAVPFTAGAILAYTFGWGWTGLLLHAVVLLNPRAPGTATGVVQMGAAMGAAIGPFAFGASVSLSGYQAAWTGAAVAAATSAALLLISRRWLKATRRSSTPS